MSKEPNNSNEIKVGQADLNWVIDQNTIWTVLIYNLKTAWNARNSFPFLRSLDIFDNISFS